MLIISHSDQVIRDMSDLNTVQVSIEIIRRHQVHTENQLLFAACDRHLSYELRVAERICFFHIFKVDVDTVQTQILSESYQLSDASPA